MTYNVFGRTLNLAQSINLYFFFFLYLPIKQRDKRVNGIQVGRTERQLSSCSYNCPQLGLWTFFVN